MPVYFSDVGWDALEVAEVKALLLGADSTPCSLRHLKHRVRHGLRAATLLRRFPEVAFDIMRTLTERGGDPSPLRWMWDNGVFAVRGGEIVVRRRVFLASWLRGAPGFRDKWRLGDPSVACSRAMCRFWQKRLIRDRAAVYTVP